MVGGASIREAVCFRAGSKEEPRQTRQDPLHGIDCVGRSGTTSLSSIPRALISARVVDKPVRGAPAHTLARALTGMKWAVRLQFKIAMGVTIELQNLGDAQVSKEISARIEHALSEQPGEWRVSISGSRESENRDMRIEGPIGFERSHSPRVPLANMTLR